MNAQPKEKTIMSTEEYLELERVSEVKHEYFDGEIFAMVGASLNHNQISGNIFGVLWSQLKQSPCRPFVNDLRVKVQQLDKYTYPDIVVACGDIELEKVNGMETLLNPIVIIEVLSDSTESYDRGTKFHHYQLIKSLQEYILVSQYSCLIEKFIRCNGNVWKYLSYDNVEKPVLIEAVKCELRLTDVYQGIEWE